MLLLLSPSSMLKLPTDVYHSSVAILVQNNTVFTHQFHNEVSYDWHDLQFEEP